MDETAETAVIAPSPSGGETADPPSDLVSVVIPTYNRVGLLPEAMDSVWAQSYRPIELVIVDDGSTDETRAAVERWTAAHLDLGRFSVRYVYQENQGLSAARNAGVAAGSGRFVQFLDSDDLLHPERLTRLVEAARTVPGFQVAVAGFQLVDERNRVLEVKPPIDLTSGDPVIRCIVRPLWAASPLYDRGFLRSVGTFRRDVAYAEDWEFGIRVALACDPRRCLAVRETLASYRLHGGPRIVTRRRTVGDIVGPFGAAAAALTRAGGRRLYFNLLAHGLLRWYFQERQGAWLRQAVRLPCSPVVKSKVLLLWLISPIVDPEAVLALWARLRGAPGRT